MFNMYISYRLELMRQIYNIESPPLQLGGCSPSDSTATAASATLLLQTKCPSFDGIQGKDMGEVHPEWLQCISECATASRLSLTNLFPSRFGYILFFFLFFYLNFVMYGMIIIKMYVNSAPL